MNSKFSLGLKLALGAATLVAQSLVWAQSTSSQPLTLIIPYPPGGSADMLAQAKPDGNTILISFWSTH
jgi:tripartite-type tricarboxylate transporter receptor subunit TctC